MTYGGMPMMPGMGPKPPVAQPMMGPAPAVMPLGDPAAQAMEESKRAAMIQQLMGQSGGGETGAASGIANALRMGTAGAFAGLSARKGQEAQNLAKGGAFNPWTAQIT